MAFKMKGFSGFKQIEKETPPKKQHNPRTYGVDKKRVEKIDTKRDIKLKNMNQGGVQEAQKIETPSKQNVVLDEVTVTPRMGMKKEFKKLPEKPDKKILPKPIGRKI
jgi:hypothetical protein